MKLQKYQKHYRMTMDEYDNAPFVGVYILAYMGQIIYIGKAGNSISDRLKNHIRKGTRIGYWLRGIEFDWHNVRLDILEPPEIQDKYWLQATEIALIRYFKPLFNDKLIPHYPTR